MAHSKSLRQYKRRRHRTLTRRRRRVSRKAGLRKTTTNVRRRSRREGGMYDEIDPKKPPKDVSGTPLDLDYTDSEEVVHRIKINRYSEAGSLYICTEYIIKDNKLQFKPLLINSNDLRWYSISVSKKQGIIPNESLNGKTIEFDIGTFTILQKPREPRMWRAYTKLNPDVNIDIPDKYIPYDSLYWLNAHVVNE